MQAIGEHKLGPSLGLLAAAMVCAAGPASAQTVEDATVVPASGPAAGPAPDEPLLSRHLQAMTAARLLPAQNATAAQLRDLVAQGERAYLEDRLDRAIVLLLEALESPRFADFADFPEFVAAEHMAGTVLYRLGSLYTARRYLERVVKRGPETSYYGPAVRRYVDVALALLDLQAAISVLTPLEGAMTEDARNELRYLRARAHYDAGDLKAAAAELRTLTKQSRFYGNAQYLLGAIAAKEKRYEHAEQRFCAVAGKGQNDRYSFYVDERFFEVQDLARLGLGRTAHEQRRGDDAFYYYFQVPQDSRRLPEAMFEAAYATYEGNEPDTAIDLLDQLEVRFPDSAFADEAGILRGYVSLARCDFAKADQHFATFVKRFTPMLGEVDRLLENPVRRRALYEELLAVEPATAQGKRPRLLLALLEVDPEFYRLHRQVRELDAEAARAGRVSDEIGAIGARMHGSDRPRALAPDTAAAGKSLQAALDQARDLALAVGEELDELRRKGASKAEVAARERELATLAQKLEQLGDRAFRLVAVAPQVLDAEPPAAGGDALGELLAQDAARSRELPARVAAVRARLVAAASARAQRALVELRKSLAGLLQRARIGRIDAVMGSKRRIEQQIESLAAGRFPAELRDPLLSQGLLADDEEYWPFEGEDWPDEYEERYGSDEDEGSK